MTSDLLTFGTTEQPASAVQSGLYPTPEFKPAEKHGKRKNSTFSKSLFENTAGFLKAHALEIDGWNRKLSATLAHLKLAQTQIAEYETQLTAQQARITLLEQLATTDELTGLKNRRGFYEGFAHELECCDRATSEGGLIVLIDLDNFKAINDTYGHAAGDAVLKLVGKTLSNQIRKVDMAARLGGDEFTLLLTNTTKAAARAELIATQLNNLSLAWYGNIIPIQASVGMSDFKTGDNMDAVLVASDVALYETKFARKKTCDATEQGGSGFLSPTG